MIENRHSSSFRDPSGFVFSENGVIKRQINPIYFKTYDALKSSNFFKVLQKKGLLISHVELDRSVNSIIIQPEQIPFVTYPYEWSFEQYKEAALLTLKLQKFAIEKGFSLKDASAYNVMFYRGRAIFIDTLSFDFYKEDSPWRAYKQFVEHFLGPLVLSKYHSASILKSMSSYIDGIPVATIASMLPFKTKLNPLLYSNIHLLAKFEGKHNEDYKGKTKAGKLSRSAQLKIIESLYGYIKSLKLNEISEWGNYYNKLNYSDKALISKTRIINQWFDKIEAKTLIDLGGNTGFFVRSITRKLEHALVCDIDNTAVDANIVELRSNQEKYIIPFVQDLLNPSPSIGFNNKERPSFLKRIKAFNPEVSMALALIHHMTLSGNVPFKMSAEFFSSFSKYLIIEFPKRNDSWVKRLLENKRDFKDHFAFYSKDNFIKDYTKYFDVVEQENIEDSFRVLFFLKRKTYVK